MWYKLPNTTNAIDTAAGITITVAATTETYMVKQDICGVIKYDTVIVHPSALGLASSGAERKGIDIFPNPAQDELNLNFAFDMNAGKVLIHNSIGQLLREEEITLKNKAAKIRTNDLENGLYFLTLKNNTETVSKRFVIAR